MKEKIVPLSEIENKPSDNETQFPKLTPETTNGEEKVSLADLKVKVAKLVELAKAIEVVNDYLRHNHDLKETVQSLSEALEQGRFREEDTKWIKIFITQLQQQPNFPPKDFGIDNHDFVREILQLDHNGVFATHLKQEFQAFEQLDSQQKWERDPFVGGYSSRSEALYLKLQKYLELIGSSREKILDPSYLPQREEVLEVIRGLREDNLEFSFWHGRFFGPLFYKEDQQHQIFEIWNQEYIGALSDYLATRVQELASINQGQSVTILEVGAGNGRLSHFLSENLKTKLPPESFQLVAVDNNSWQQDTVFPVEEMSLQEALPKYQPQVVIFSWMPWMQDFTTDFRACESVQEYLLIGEADGGCCGDEWETWGYRDFDYLERSEVRKEYGNLPSKAREYLATHWSSEGQEFLAEQSRRFGELGMSEKNLSKTQRQRLQLEFLVKAEVTTPYGRDGFSKNYLKEISQHQTCRTDYIGKYDDIYHRYSSTHSFRREK